MPMVLTRNPLSGSLLHPTKIATNRERGTFGNCYTCIARRIKCLVAGWQHMNVSVTEGSLVDEDNIRVVWATNEREHLTC